MKNVKMPTSDSYREFLIECLKDPEHAAGYIEAILEEKDPEPELLRNALRKVAEAHAESNKLSESAKEHHEKLDKILTQSGGCRNLYLNRATECTGFSSCDQLCWCAKRNRTQRKLNGSRYRFGRSRLYQ
jgi:DNA-binding phage protein